MDDLTTSFDNAKGKEMPQNIEVPSDANYAGELTAYVTNDEFIEGLPNSSREPSVTTNDRNNEMLQEQRPATATAKRAGNQISRHVTHDDEFRLRHAERQKRYRERQRQEEADVKKQITETAAEAEKARVERDILLNQHTVLSKAVEYCSYTVHAAQNLVSSTISRAHSQYHSAVEGLAWLGLQVYSPSDSQLQAFVDKNDIEQLDAMSAKVLTRSVELFTRYDADPEARENIEAQLARIRSIRFRCLKHLAKTRPDVVIEMARRRMMPTGPNGTPNSKLEEAVVALELTPEQLESFERQWTFYLQRTASVHQEVRSLISFLSSSGAGESIASLCSMEAASLFLHRLDVIQELELHPSTEAQAIITLFIWLPVNLTTQQKTTLMKHSMPFYPDIIQIGRILFGETCGNNHSTQSGQVQSIYSDLEPF